MGTISQHFGVTQNTSTKEVASPIAKVEATRYEGEFEVPDFMKTKEFAEKIGRVLAARREYRKHNPIRSHGDK